MYKQIMYKVQDTNIIHFICMLHLISSRLNKNLCGKCSTTGLKPRPLAFTIFSVIDIYLNRTDKTK